MQARNDGAKSAQAETPLRLDLDQLFPTDAVRPADIAGTLRADHHRSRLAGNVRQIHHVVHVGVRDHDEVRAA